MKRSSVIALIAIGIVGYVSGMKQEGLLVATSA
jgi:hypothetical protein